MSANRRDFPRTAALTGVAGLGGPSHAGRMRSFLLALLSAGALAACDKPAEPVVPPADEFSTALLRAALVVNDIDASRDFYHQALGFEPGFDGDITSRWVTDLLQLQEGQTVRFAILEGSDSVAGEPTHSAMIGLLEIDNPRLPQRPRPEGITVTTGEAVLAMVTSDIERVHARVQELGATVLFGPQQSVSGTESELVFYDLDGIRVHVVERNE